MFPIVLLAVLKVLLTNDDGWATASHNLLNTSNIKSILCAPAENKSGSGSLDFPPTVRTEPCQWNTCPTGSSLGHNDSDPTLNYVNSYPVTAVNYALGTLSPELFNSPPDIVISGPNIGLNFGMSIFVSGTIGAAAAAAQHGIPSLAISASSGEQVSYTSFQDNDVYSIHARLSLRIIAALTSTRSSAPILPPNSFLNVNYPPVTDPCLTPTAFTFVLTRAFSTPFADNPYTCGKDTLPLEGDVLGNEGSCEVSISVLDAGTKLDKGREAQEAVLNGLEGFLGCSTA